MILARLVRLGFIANFLSRTVLIGFLTGVGIQVALGQLGGMLGITGVSGKTIPKFIDTLGKLGETSLTTLAVTVERDRHDPRAEDGLAEDPRRTVRRRRRDRRERRRRPRRRTASPPSARSREGFRASASRAGSAGAT